MKNKEELNNLKKDIEELNKKLSELTDEEVKEVVGGKDIGRRIAIILDSYAYIAPEIKQ